MAVKLKTSTINTTCLTGRRIEWIVIHYTAGSTSKAGAAENVAEWFMSGSAKASSDFIVDDEIIVRYNPDIPNRYTWGVGGNKYNVLSTSLAGQFYGKCTNKNCINIEVCSNKKNPKSLDANDRDWFFTEKELSLLSVLVKELMQEYGIDSDHIIMHHHVTGKLCPAMWTHDESELVGWYDFKRAITSEKCNEKLPEEAKENTLFYVQVGAFTVKSYAEAYLKKAQKQYPNAFIKTSGKLFYVQVGAFTVKSYAEAYLKKAQKQYPDAFIKAV